MHLVKAFTQLHVRKIPSAYILKRYTHDAGSFVEWDRNDMPKDGQDGNREDMRFAKLVPVVMGIARVGTKSDYACDEAYEKSTALRDHIDSILVNVTQLVPTDNAVPDVNLDRTLMVAIAAPPLSQTKGVVMAGETVTVMWGVARYVQVRINVNSLSMGKRSTALKAAKSMVLNAIT
jgi:hypothetical protein